MNFDAGAFDQDCEMDDVERVTEQPLQQSPGSGPQGQRFSYTRRSGRHVRKIGGKIVPASAEVQIDKQRENNGCGHFRTATNQRKISHYSLLQTVGSSGLEPGYRNDPGFYLYTGVGITFAK